MICWKCAKTIDDCDAYCRYCGTGQGKNVPWFYKFWGICILFVLIGPLNLWCIYRSPLIKPVYKWLSAVLFIGLSCVAIYKFYIALSGIFSVYMDLLNMPIY